MSLNNAHVMGYIHDIEEKAYDDGVTITHFNLHYQRATRTDVFSCRVVSRLCPKRPAEYAKEGDYIVLTGHLTTFGTTSPRLGIEVCWWNQVNP